MFFLIKKLIQNDFYQLKKDLLDSDNSKLLMKHRMIEQMIEKNANDLLNRRLNLLTIWSTIFSSVIFLYWIVWYEL